MGKRIPLSEEPIADMNAIVQYDKGAKVYMVPEYKYFVRKILHRGINKGKVLDVGTGSGLLAIELARTKGCDFEITAIDISANMIKKARENAYQAGVGDKIKFVVATAAELPFESGAFDLVMSYASLHHWFEPISVFNEINRVIKAGGDYIIRDNKRLYENPLLTAIVWVAARFMNKRHRENWPKALRASYTIPEIKGILKKTELQNWRVISDFMLVDLSIESRR